MAPRKSSASTALRVVPRSAAKAEIISQPSVRVLTHWTPGHLQRIQQYADGGDLNLLGDLCDQMLGDDRFGQLLEQLAGDVLGCELSFEQNPRGTVGDAQYAKQLEADWPLGYSEDELASLLIWCELVGVAFARHEHWIDSEEGRIVPRLKWWHPRHFVYDHAKRGWFRKDAFGKRYPVQSGDGEWVILTRRGDFRPWANGLWRGLARWWLLKAYAISDWGVHSEKAAKLVLGTAEGANPEDRRAVADEIFQMAKDAVISLPAGFTLDLIEIGANTEQIYNKQIEASDMGAAIAILGQNLTSRVDGGSYAAAQTHERVKNSRVRYASQTLSRGLYTQSLPWWAEYNFGDRKLAPYPKWQTDPPEDKGAKTTVLSTLATAIGTLQTAGYRLRLEDIETEYGVKLEEIPPEEQKAQVDAQQPTPQPPPPIGDKNDPRHPDNRKPVLPSAGVRPKPTPKGLSAARAEAAPVFGHVAAPVFGHVAAPVYLAAAKSGKGKGLIGKFDASKHPRGKGGKFAKKGTSTEAAAAKPKAPRKKAAPKPKAKTASKPKPAKSPAKPKPAQKGLTGKTHTGKVAPKPKPKAEPKPKPKAPAKRKNEVVAQKAATQARTAELKPKQVQKAAAARERVRQTIAAERAQPEPKPLPHKPGDSVKLGSAKPGGAIQPLPRADIEAVAPHAGTALAAKLNPASDRHSAAFKALPPEQQRELYRQAYAFEPTGKAIVAAGASKEHADRAQQFLSSYISGPSGQAAHAHRLKQVADGAHSDLQVRGSWAQKHYAATQALIEHQLPRLRAEKKVDADGFVTLYRGLQGPQAQGILGKHKHGDRVELDVNKLSSWSDDPDMARKFGGVIIKTKVHYSRAFFSHHASTRAHDDEREWLVLHDEQKAHGVFGASAEL